MLNEWTNKVYILQNSLLTVSIEEVLSFSKCLHFGGSNLEKGDSQNHWTMTCPIDRVYIYHQIPVYSHHSYAQSIFHSHK